MRVMAFVFVTFISGITMASGQTREVDLAQDAVGEPPKGFRLTK